MLLEWKKIEVNEAVKNDIVYRLPKDITAEPISLLNMIKAAKTPHSRPALEKRFELAYKLASAVSLLHATNWLHKSFRRDCISFGSSSASVHLRILVQSDECG